MNIMMTLILAAGMASAGPGQLCASHVGSRPCSEVPSGLSLGGLSFDAANGFGGNFCPGKCYADVQDGKLTFVDIARDSRVVWDSLAFDPAGSTAIVFRYRAVGTGPEGGQFFWAHAGEEFSDARRCLLKPLVADGQWHDVTLDKKDFSDYKNWKNGGVVTRVRFDPIQSPGGRIELAYLRVEDPSASGVQAASAVSKGLDEGVWPAVCPDFLPESHFASPTTTVACRVKGLGGWCETDRAHAGSDVRFRLRFKGELPKADFGGCVEFVDRGRVCWKSRLSFSAAAARATAKDVWELSFPLTLPRYFSTRTLRWRFVSDEISVSGSQPSGMLEILRAPYLEGQEKPLVSCVRELNGNPEFFVNGKPFYARWGVAQMKRTDGLTRLGPMPLNVLTVWNWPAAWRAPDGSIIDSHFDEEASRVLAEQPDVYLMWDLSVSPSAKWQHEHPDEQVCDDKGGCRYYSTMPPHSFASRSAAEDMSQAVEQAIAYLEKSPYANRIIGYRISGGETPEWLAFRPERGRVYDFSPVARQAFKDWARDRYPELGDAEVPSLADRQELDDGALLWSDPKRHLATIAFHEFYSEMVSDTLIEVSRRAKTVLGGRKVVGTYCGYTMYLNAKGGDHMRGHFALKKVLDSKAVDFVMSPQAYTHSLRRLGGSLGDMKPFRSLEKNGIVAAIENDLRTHHSPPGLRCDQTLTPYQTVMTVRRDMSIELCRRHPAYALNMCCNVALDFPEMEEEGRVFQQLTDHLFVSKPPRRTAEVALVVSEKTILGMPMLNQYVPSGLVEQIYLTNGLVQVVSGGQRPILTGEIFGDLPLRFARAGAPVDYLLAEDLSDHPGDYKLYVFAANYRFDERFRAAVERLRNRGASLLWLYAPGYMKGRECSLANMRELTGISFERNSEPMAAEAKMSDGRMMGQAKVAVTPTFVPVAPDEIFGRYANGQPAVTAVRTGGATSYFCGTWKIDSAFLRELYRRAGVHVYTEEGDPVEANEKLFTLHARFAGVKQVKLPRRTDVLDVYGRRIVARQADEFSFTASLHSTWLFYCGDDADALLGKLNGEDADR